MHVRVLERKMEWNTVEMKHALTLRARNSITWRCLVEMIAGSGLFEFMHAVWIRKHFILAIKEQFLYWIKGSLWIKNEVCESGFVYFKWVEPEEIRIPRCNTVIFISYY